MRTERGTFTSDTFAVLLVVVVAASIIGGGAALINQAYFGGGSEEIVMSITGNDFVDMLDGMAFGETQPISGDRDVLRVPGGFIYIFKKAGAAVFVTDDETESGALLDAARKRMSEVSE